jgi:hypothetical protein
MPLRKNRELKTAGFPRFLKAVPQRETINCGMGQLLKPRTEELKFVAAPQPFAQFAPAGMKTSERDIRVNHDANGVHCRSWSPCS